jgi:hypothetical protein
LTFEPSSLFLRLYARRVLSPAGIPEEYWMISNSWDFELETQKYPADGVLGVWVVKYT